MCNIVRLLWVCYIFQIITLILFSSYYNIVWQFSRIFITIHFLIMEKQTYFLCFTCYYYVNINIFSISRTIKKNSVMQNYAIFIHLFRELQVRLCLPDDIDVDLTMIFFFVSRQFLFLQSVTS